MNERIETDLGGTTDELAAAPDFPALLRGSGLFDRDFYCEAAGVDLDADGAIAHFLERGEPDGVSPGPDFDVGFYHATYPDVAAAGMNALVHYLVHGRGEHRYTDTAALERDLAIIAGSGLFDLPFYARQAGRVFFTQTEAIRHYLFLGESIELKPNADFDRDFYRRRYDDAHGNAFAHYLVHGLREARIASARKLERLCASQAARALFDHQRYALDAGLEPGTEAADALEHYFLHGVERGLQPCARFDHEYYLASNPDLAGANVLHSYHPFWHFAEHGEREGRLAWYDFDAAIAAGGRVFDRNRPTCICVNHAASRTGAPLVGLALVRTLAARYNVITLTGVRGELDESFGRFSCLYGEYPPSAAACRLMLKQLLLARPIDFAITNSVETSPFIDALAHRRIATVALVHEFAEYSHPKGKVAQIAMQADRCVFPAELVLDSLRKEFERGAVAGEPLNCVVRPQGRLAALPRAADEESLTREELLACLRVPAGADVRIVVGAGYVQPRKGVDIFVQTAIQFRRRFGDDFRFLWVGEGYEPDTDVHCSVWIHDAIARAGLADHVFMLDAQPDLDTVFGLADVFYLPSRLDPFPNVVIDALAAGVPVVCFEAATGCAEFLRRHRAPAWIASYLDPGDAAEGLLRCLDPAHLAGCRPGPEIVREELDFGQYAAFIERQALEARTARAARERRITELNGNRFLDPLFHSGRLAGGREPELLSDYLTAAASGVLRHAPRPGFDPFLAGSADAALRFTHDCRAYRENVGMPEGDGLRAAVHLHLHYPELARHFAEAFAPWQERFDFFVSLTDEDAAQDVAVDFGDFRSVRFGVFPNRGRNFGPLLCGEFVEALRGYDLIGHFHGKKSEHGDAGGGFGGSWREFILETLVGRRGEVLPFVLDCFVNDPHLGLLFPEDRHLVGWGANREHARELLARLGLGTEAPAYLRFPLGGMFWARRAVLEPLWALGLRLEDLPAEPLPYDGTLLHALERIVPLLAAHAGHGWATVHRAGVSW